MYLQNRDFSNVNQLDMSGYCPQYIKTGATNMASWLLHSVYVAKGIYFWTFAAAFVKYNDWCCHVLHDSV